MLNVQFSASTYSPVANVDSKEPAVTPKTRARRRRARELLPFEVNMLAARLTAATKVAARSALQDLDVAPTDDQIHDILECRKCIETRRLRRHVQNAELRLGHSLRGMLPAPSGRNAVYLPTTPLETRLDTLRLQAVKHAAERLFRHGAAGGSSFRVTYASTSGEVAYRVAIGSNWDTYKGSYKGWRANEDHHVVTVPKDWRLRVLRRGLATVGGMMTLDAHALESPEGVELYAAVWASQGRGFDVRTHRGFIAVCAGEAYHCDTAEGAIAGARRKARAANCPPTLRATPYSIGVDEFVHRYSKVECEARLDDARDSGSCEFGIRSWCNAVGLKYEEGEAPLHVVLDAFRQRPQIEVRRAVLHAVRRHRACRRGV